MMEKCERGQHSLEKIYEHDQPMPGVSNVVRWCKICGSVVVDVDCDGRTQAGRVIKMKSPLIARKGKCLV